MINWLSDQHIQLLEHIVNSDKKSENEVYDLIFGLFQVDLKKEIQHQFVFLKYAGLQPDSIKEMAYWEWQLMLEELNDYMEKEKEAREKEEGKGGTYKNTKEYQEAQSSMKSMGVDPNRIGSSSSSSSRLGNFGNFNSSSMRMPKL